MPNLNVILPEHFERFIASGVASGRFSDANEMIREALQLLEEREREDEVVLRRLRGAVVEGVEAVDAGDYVAIESENELKGFLREIRREAGEPDRSEPDIG